jgi:hypothetical protein
LGEVRTHDHRGLYLLARTGTVHQGLQLLCVLLQGHVLLL